MRLRTWCLAWRTSMSPRRASTLGAGDLGRISLRTGSSSQLQQAAGTVVILDETSLAEGQLQDAGTRNAVAIRDLIRNQSLTCDFTSYDVKLPLELQVISVSARRSLFPFHDVLLPLRPTAPTSDAASSEAMDAVRMFLALVTRSPKALRISEAVSNQFAEDFTAVRQQPDVEPELCNTWMGLARAHCLLSGDDELTPERWQVVRDLEGERLARCRAEKLLPSH
jgi:hypothetical protein